MAGSDFNADFYLTTGAVIPVLWLTAGFATEAISRMMTRLERKVPGLIILVIAPFLGGFASLLSGAITGVLIGVLGNRLAALVFAALRRLFAVGYVLAGVVGETLSLLALFLRDSSFVLRTVTLISVLVLVAVGPSCCSSHSS
jgi:hypothetical protein